MSKIVWDETGKRYLESGVSKGVLYCDGMKTLLVADVTNATLGTKQSLVSSAEVTDESQVDPVTHQYLTRIPAKYKWYYPEGDNNGWMYTRYSVESMTVTLDGEPIEDFVASRLRLASIAAVNQAPFRTYESYDAAVAAIPYSSIGTENGKCLFLGIEPSGEMYYYRTTKSVADFDVFSDVFEGEEESFTVGNNTVTSRYVVGRENKKASSLFDSLFRYQARNGTFSAITPPVSGPPLSLYVISGDTVYHVYSTRMVYGTYLQEVNTPSTSSPTQGGLMRVNSMAQSDPPIFYTGKVGVPWNGLTSVSSSPEGAEDNEQWADNMKYSRTKSKETWSGTIEAYQSPAEFDKCDGSAEAAAGVLVGQQKRESFGLCYRTEIMSDTSGGESVGYLLHILYNLTASPSERAYETINDSPDAITLSWEIDGVPINVDGYEPLTEITVDSRYANSEKLSALEDALYGDDILEPRLPTPTQLVSMFNS